MQTAAKEPVLEPTVTTAAPPDYFVHHFDIEWSRLLAPIRAEQPCGDNLRGNGVYRAIQEARRYDDASLPQGPWTHELKRADWDKVASLATAALANKSKDLQVAAWLLEANIHRDGFAGIAPCLLLIRDLCAHHWEQLYPRPLAGGSADDAGNDIEYRTNVLHWINEKLLPAIRLVPLTHTARDERDLTWADWEQAKRNEQRRVVNSDEQPEGMGPLEFGAAMAGTPTAWLRERFQSLETALRSIEQLTLTLIELCGDEAPSLNQMSGLLEQIQTFIDTELHKRGVRTEQSPTSAVASAVVAEEPTATHELRDRASAYALLAELADFLQHVEPHSPVPYLLKRAVAWGNLNTAELYQEVFIRCGGHLNIFELLGVQPASQDNAP